MFKRAPFTHLLYRYKTVSLLLLTLISVTTTPLHSKVPYDTTDSVTIMRIDHLISQMSSREKFAQLIILAFNDNPNNRESKETLAAIKEEKIGGVILMRSKLEEGIEMLNRFHSATTIPLLVTIDAEWGVSMRLSEIEPFQRHMQLGAIEEQELIYQVGKAIGEQTKRVGAQINFTPSVDINNNPENPVIHTRSFGEGRERVTTHASSLLAGLKSTGVMGSIKHFPGHGDTDVDSHHALPILPFDYNRLDSIELYPYKKMIESGVEMVMVSHLALPKVDSSGRAASISHPIITGLLKERLQFKGLITTDALGMKGSTDEWIEEEIALEAFKAGVDILLMPTKIGKSLDVMERALKRGEISEEELNSRVKKMLLLKARFNILDGAEPVKIEGLKEELNGPRYIELAKEIANHSMVVVKNENHYLPFQNFSEKRPLLLSLLSNDEGELFRELKGRYCYREDDIIVKKGESRAHYERLFEKLEGEEDIVVAVHATDIRPQMNFGIDENFFEQLELFSKERNVTLLYFGNPLALSKLGNLSNYRAIVVAHQNIETNFYGAAHLLFGAIDGKGIMPVTTTHYPLGHSVECNEVGRVRYQVPFKNIEPYKELLLNIKNESSQEENIENYSLLLLHNRDILYYKEGTPVELERIGELLTLLPAVIKAEEEGLLSLQESYNSTLISDYLMLRSEWDGEEYQPPHYNRDELKKLRELLEERVGEPLLHYMERELLSPIGVELVSDYSGEEYKLFGEANQLAKVAALLLNGGSYGGVRFLTEEGAENALLYTHYYQNHPNGSLFWIDPESKSALIFLHGEKRKSELGAQVRDHFLRFIEKSEKTKL